ncbi:lipoprotein lprE, partial [Mycobacterium tuberculosis EAS054]
MTGCGSGDSTVAKTPEATPSLSLLTRPAEQERARR